MKKINSNLVVSLLSAVIILIGMTGYFSFNGFIKPVAYQLILGYFRNEVEEPSISNKLKSIPTNISEFANEKVRFRTSFVEINSAVQKLLGSKVIDEVVRMDNGYLTNQYDEIDDATIEGYADSVRVLNDYLTEQNIPLVFFLAPFKNSKYDYQLPDGLKDTMNYASDRFISMIDKYDIDYIDFRDELYNEGYDQYSCFYVTDHHWKAETGFWAFTKIARKLNGDYKLEYDNNITDISNYNIKVYKDWFLGSLGKKVGKYFAGVDDISIITPKFETDFTVEQPLKNEKVRGSFDDTLMKMSFVEKKDYYNLNAYETYSGGDFAYQIITNNNVANDTNILIIRDSFACSVTPFLALAAKELHVLDLRDSLTGFETGSLYNYINEIKPCTVVFLYSPVQFTICEAFNFHE